MKPTTTTTTNLTTALLLFTNLTLSTAWTFTYGDPPLVVNGDDENKGCTLAPILATERFKWDRGVFSDCCIHLYAANTCTASSQVGYSCSDWDKVASQRISAFTVTNC
ncbi:hypothetical protein LTS18_005281 [Coniosporium uncinatum]|uniref:Uncharacterized protein n=1 Tax=Coniosporium uncinatum TaxID=93489 RepID=A0ACC3DRF4_9PEZI|nr:hypothetical protein LTS18_005281 [Coniosporium uncinatum]